VAPPVDSRVVPSALHRPRRLARRLVSRGRARLARADRLTLAAAFVAVATGAFTFVIAATLFRYHSVNHDEGCTSCRPRCCSPVSSRSTPARWPTPSIRGSLSRTAAGSIRSTTPFPPRCTPCRCGCSASRGRRSRSSPPATRRSCTCSDRPRSIGGSASRPPSSSSPRRWRSPPPRYFSRTRPRRS